MFSPTRPLCACLRDGLERPLQGLVSWRCWRLCSLLHRVVVAACYPQPRVWQAFLAREKRGVVCRPCLLPWLFAGRWEEGRV